MKASQIKTICFDIDGTLYMDEKLLPHALETVSALSQKYNIAFVTNTTSKSISSIHKELEYFGFNPLENTVFNPARVAREYLTANNLDSGILLIEKEAENDYAWFRRVKPDDKGCASVLVGTEGYDLTFRDLSAPLEALLKGARLFTLQKNRFYKKAGVYLTDLGPFAAALEYAASCSSTCFGKPSKSLFQSVAQRFGHSINELAMVGDDIEFDIFGAQDLGITAVLVKTGKYNAKFAAKFDKQPAYQINTLKTLEELLNSFHKHGSTTGNAVFGAAE
jgi:HAD superfamily hydrolase (TIGR01458 family)